MSRRLLIAGLLFAVVSSALAADWPRFRGPAGSGTSPEKGLPLT